jgi:hypothetical protein
MTADQERKLARIKNDRTRYELVMTGPAGQFLACYSSFPTRRTSVHKLNPTPFPVRHTEK